MTPINKNNPVLVTGATGYVAGRLIEKLLSEGLTVHAAVRDPDNAEKLKYLNALAEKTPGTIRYYKADLLKEGSYAEAMKGCELVYHTASPFTLDVSDPQKDLIDPAKLGTRNVLETATQIDSVKRIVLTSSCAAIYGDNADLKDTPDGVFTEEIWNTSSSIDHSPYSFSKTVAEQEAWNLAKSQNQWDLVTINPSLVIGPGINPHATSESFNILKQLGDGTFKSGIPDIGMGVVDVREVASAHFEAGFRPEASGRYIVNAHNSSFFQMAQTLLPDFGKNYPIPRKRIPKFLLLMLGPVIDKRITRKYVARNVNLPFKADHSKSIRELGISYRTEKESMVEFFQQAIEAGAFDK